MRFLLLFFVAVIAGCAALPERPPAEDRYAAWEAQRQSLARLDAWELRGRLALRANGQGVNASIRWVRDRDNHRIDLTGPFGGGRARILLTKDGAELRDASNKVYRDVSVENLLMRVTGWSLPLESLRYWVVGLPVPEQAARMEIDEWGRLSLLEQQGWRIRYLEYAQAGPYELPRRLFVEVTGRGASEEPIDARIAIESWIPGSMPAVPPQ